MDCKQITTGIKEIGSQVERLDAGFEVMSAEEMSGIYENVSQEGEKIINETFGVPAKAFLEYCQKQETIIRIEEVVQKINIETQGFTTVISEEKNFEFFQELTAIFDGLNSALPFNSLSYKYFLALVEEGKLDYLIPYKGFLGSFNSIFLNKFIKDRTIKVGRLPDQFKDNFGSYLETGRVILDEAGDNLGYGLRGGVIHVQRCGDRGGVKAQSGKIFVHERAAKGFGDSAKGGFLYAYSASSGLADHMQGSVTYVPHPDRIGKIERGTLLLDNQFDQFNSSSTFKREIVYLAGSEGNQIPKEYWNGLNQGTYLPSTVEIVLQKNTNNGVLPDALYVLGKKENFGNFNPTEGISRGAFIIHELFDDLGKDMTGGVIIIEIAGMTAEEVRRHISKDKKGGAILLRVPDATDGTKLIDVEEEQYDF